MTTLVTIRPPEGDPYDLAIDGTEFVEPDDRATKQIDTAHLFALPGLADAHAHLTMTSYDDISGITEDTMRANVPVTAWAHVERGVLLILDKGGNTDTTLVSLDHDADLRPYVETAGAMIHPTDGYMAGYGVEVEPDELLEYLRTKAAIRGGWVKIVGDWPRRGIGPVNNYPIDTLTEAVQIAHDAGVRVAVHTMANAASDAVAAGVDSIEHGPFLTEQDIRVLAARGGAWVPTIGNQKHWIDALGADSSGGKLFAAGLDRIAENLPLAEELDLTVLAGSDLAIEHGQIATEARLLRDHGLTDRAATIATSTAAFDYVGREAALSPGHIADVVFFADNPYEDVTVLDRPEIIIHRGTIIE
ncbi:MAG: amidohydrolase family protein [Acidimicrobiia bacterium]|nr:MAG: amidohydrolase family protein [Acidimicrobiia bacterium]